MARPQRHFQPPVEYISSPPPHPPRPITPTANTPHHQQPQQTGFYQHSSPPSIYHSHHPSALIRPTSPLVHQFNGTIHQTHTVPIPGVPYPIIAHPAAQQYEQPLPGPVARQQTAVTRITSPVQLPVPPPNFGVINSGNRSAFSPPSFSWITHTQSPPLHPFPPPSTLLTHLHPIQSAPPRLSHSPAVPPQAYICHDPTYGLSLQQQVQPPVPAHDPQTLPTPDTFPPVHHHHHHHLSMPDLPSQGGVGQANFQIRGGTPQHNHPQILSLPCAHPHPPAHLPQELASRLPQQHVLPAATNPSHLADSPIRTRSPPLLPLPMRDAWIQSPPAPHPLPSSQPQSQQVYQISSSLSQAPVMPQSHSHQSRIPSHPLPPHAQVQFLPQTASEPVAPTAGQGIDGKAAVTYGQILTPTTPATQVSEPVTSTTVQLLQPPLQHVTMSTVVRPTPIYTTQAPPGFLSRSSESGFPSSLTGPSHFSRLQISAEQQRPVGQHKWIASRSQVIPRNDLPSSVLTTIPQGSTPDSVLEQTHPLAIPMSSQEAKEVDEYTEFALIFKNHRLKLGYTHADVIQQVGIRYGYSFSMDTIAKFELIQLSLGTVRSLKPILQMWLKDTVKAAGTSEDDMKEIIVHASTSINPKRERKRRTNVDSVIKSQLEEEFRRKRTPSQSEMQAMANRMGMEKEFIRVWFCNRRQRQKKLEKELKARASRQTSSCSPKATLPSPSHDITVEVPSIHPRDMGSPVHEGYSKFLQSS